MDLQRQDEVRGFAETRRVTWICRDKTVYVDLQIQDGVRGFAETRRGTWICRDKTKYVFSNDKMIQIAHYRKRLLLDVKKSILFSNKDGKNFYIKLNQENIVVVFHCKEFSKDSLKI